MKRIIQLTLLVLSISFSCTSNAYVGIRAGYGNAGWSSYEQTVFSDHFLENYPLQAINNGSFVGGVFLGYPLNPYFELQLNYVNFFNKAYLNGQFSAPNGEVGLWHIKTFAYAFTLQWNMPRLGPIIPYAQFGIDYLYSDMSPILYTNHKTHNANYGLAYGFGLKYPLSPRFSTGVSWLHYSGNPNYGAASIDLSNYHPFGTIQPSIDLYTANLTYYFDKNTQRMPVEDELLQNRYAYFGGTAGYAWNGWAIFNIPSVDATVSGQRAFAYGGFAGYQIMKYLGIQAEYNRLSGQAKLTANGELHYAIETQIFAGMVRLQLPRFKGIGLFTKIGPNYLHSKLIGKDGVSQSKTISTVNVAYGFGLDYSINPKFLVGVSWTRYMGSQRIGYDTISPYYPLGSLQPYTDILAFNITVNI